MQKERERGSLGKPSQILDPTEEGPLLSRAGRIKGGKPNIRCIMQVKLRENLQLNPQHQSKEKGKMRNTDVLSLSFAAGVKSANLDLKEHETNVRWGLLSEPTLVYLPL